MAGLTPRRLGPDAAEAALLVALERATFPDRPGRWQAPDYQALAQEPGAVVLSDRDLACAYVVLRVVGDEAEILDLGVIPSARRQGWGRALVADGIKAAREHGAARLFLEVADDNAPALGLYQGAGFTPVGSRTGYYARPNGDRVDALVLALALT
ncbi:MAG: N-acetyltransferase [Pseudomonadota bacterium]